MLSSFGIRAYRHLPRKFFSDGFSSTNLLLHTGLGSGILCQALEVGGMRGLTTVVALQSFA